MTKQFPRPERTLEATDRRRFAVRFADAAAQRQDAPADPFMDELNARYIAGDVTTDEMRAEILAAVRS